MTSRIVVVSDNNGDEVKHLVFLRDNLRCVHCGTPYKVKSLDAVVENELRPVWQANLKQAAKKGVSIQTVAHGRCAQCMQLYYNDKIQVAQQDKLLEDVALLTAELETVLRNYTGI